MIIRLFPYFHVIFGQRELWPIEKLKRTLLDESNYDSDTMPINVIYEPPEVSDDFTGICERWITNIYDFYYQDDQYDFESLDDNDKDYHAADFFYCIYDQADIPTDFKRSQACQQYIKAFYFLDSVERASYETSGGKCIEDYGDSYEMENELYEMLENLIYTSKFTPMNIEASMEVQSINEVMIHERSEIAQKIIL